MPSRRPRSSSVAIPGKRNGVDSTVPSGEMSMLAGDPGRGMAVHERDQRIQRMLLHDRVGVQEQHVLRRVVRLQRRADHGIVAPGESPVGVDHGQLDPRAPPVLVDGPPEPTRRIAPGPVLAHRDPAPGTRPISPLSERRQSIVRSVTRYDTTTTSSLMDRPRSRDGPAAGRRRRQRAAAGAAPVIREWASSQKPASSGWPGWSRSAWSIARASNCRAHARSPSRVRHGQEDVVEGRPAAEGPGAIEGVQRPTWSSPARSGRPPGCSSRPRRRGTRPPPDSPSPRRRSGRGGPGRGGWPAARPGRWRSRTTAAAPRRRDRPRGGPRAPRGPAARRPPPRPDAPPA